MLQFYRTLHRYAFVVSDAINPIPVRQWISSRVILLYIWRILSLICPSTFPSTNSNTHWRLRLVQVSFPCTWLNLRQVEDLIQRLNFMFSELYATIILHKEVNGIEMAKNPSKPSSRSHSRNDPLFRVGNWTKETIYMKVRSFLYHSYPCG